MDFDTRMVATTSCCMKPLLTLKAKRSASLGALLHTATAATMIGGAVKDNVLPTEGQAVINFRIMPGETPDSVLDHVRRAVADPRVKVAVFGEHPSTPSAESSPAAAPFNVLQRTIRQLYPATVVTPYLVVGATASRYYTPLPPHL